MKVLSLGTSKASKVAVATTLGKPIEREERSADTLKQCIMANKMIKDMRENEDGALTEATIGIKLVVEPKMIEVRIGWQNTANYDQIKWSQRKLASQKNNN